MNGQHGSPALLRLINAQKIYDIMLAATPTPLSRAEGARLSGLSKPTASAVMSDLEDAGLVRPAKQVGATERPGRPAALYEIRPDAGVAIAVDLGSSQILIGAATITGEVIAERCVPSAPSAGPAITLSIEAVRDLVSELGADARVGSICIAVPGIYRPETDTVDAAYSLPGFGELRVGERFESELGVPVIVENDVNLAAIGESSSRDPEVSADFAVVSIGAGIGAGIVVGGRIYRGAGGAAGEIGSIVIEPRDEGRPLTLEDVASASAIEKLFAQAVEDGVSSDLLGDQSAAAILEAAQQGDHAAAKAVDRSAEAAALAISHICFLVDPRSVVLAGEIGAHDTYVSAVEEALERLLVEPPDVTASSIRGRAAFRGAVTTAVRATLDTLVISRLGTRSG